MRIEPVTPDPTDVAVELLARFFAEEGFGTPPADISRNLRDMLGDGSCWSALAVEAAAAVGVVTVTTMRYVEWGLLGEIGDIYVLPAWRCRGTAAMMIGAALIGATARDALRSRLRSRPKARRATRCQSSMLGSALEARAARS
jgi:hypothetical protein